MPTAAKPMKALTPCAVAAELAVEALAEAEAEALGETLEEAAKTGVLVLEAALAAVLEAASVLEEDKVTP